MKRLITNLQNIWKVEELRKRIILTVLGRGELKAKVNITANGFSSTAIAAIEALGGTCTKI